MEIPEYTGKLPYDFPCFDACEIHQGSPEAHPEICRVAEVTVLRVEALGLKDWL